MSASQSAEDDRAYIAQLRGPLLHYWGTTDPELLAEVWEDRAKAIDVDKLSGEFRARELSALPSGEPAPDVCPCEKCVDLRKRISANDEPRNVTALNEMLARAAEIRAENARVRARLGLSDEPRETAWRKHELGCPLSNGQSMQGVTLYCTCEQLRRAPITLDEPRRVLTRAETRTAAVKILESAERSRLPASDEPREVRCPHCDGWMGKGSPTVETTILAAVLAEVAALPIQPLPSNAPIEYWRHRAACAIQQMQRLSKEGA